MGLFKQVKQMKEAVSEAPDMVRSAMEMQQAALDASRSQTPGAGAPPPGSPPIQQSSGTFDDEIVSNVSLARYADICRAGSTRGITDLAGIAEVAEEFGISRDDWDGAVTGWNSRFAHDTPAAVRFNALWRGVG
jgi:hypothetical protein